MVFAGVVYTAEHSCANKWLIVFNFVAKTQAMWDVWLYTHWINVLWQQEDLRSHNLRKPLHQCFLTIVLDSSLRMNSLEKKKSPSLLLLLAVRTIIMSVKPPLHVSNQSHWTYWYLRDKKKSTPSKPDVPSTVCSLHWYPLPDTWERHQSISFCREQ